MMPRERINDCDLYYETSGTGPDVIFLHGEDHGIEMFKNQISDLRQDFRCIGYYRRGHGKSQLAPFGYSLHNQVLDLAVLLDYLNSQTTVIVAVAMANNDCRKLRSPISRSRTRPCAGIVV
jgi:pimeloyl-ACP methyl ester carboxylesterase